MHQFVKIIAEYRKLSTVLGLLLFFAIADYAHFISICHKHSKLSYTAEELLPKPMDKEIIVVLTGDRKRIPMAIDLLRKRKSSQLLISGAGKGATLTELVNSQESQAGKVREVWNQITVESKSTSTIENAHESGKIFQKLGIRRVILVTSEYHMLRSQLIFQSMNAGYEYYIYPVASEFTHVLQGDFSEIATAFVKTTVEYWKYLAFRNYFLAHLYD